MIRFTRLPVTRLPSQPGASLIPVHTNLCGSDGLFLARDGRLRRGSREVAEEQRNRFTARYGRADWNLILLFGESYLGPAIIHRHLALTASGVGRHFCVAGLDCAL